MIISNINKQALIGRLKRGSSCVVAWVGRPLRAKAGHVHGMKLKGVLGLAIVWLSLGANLQGQELELRYSEGMMLTWNDGGSDGDNDGAFWAPFVPKGFFAINHTARSNYNSPSLNLFVARALREDSRPLAAPIGYELIWTDSGSGADRDGAFWRLPAVT